MAGEIRILEDQLYEADYHNRVLNDQLERCRVKAQTGRGSATPAPPPESANHSALSPKSSVTTPMPAPIQQSDPAFSQPGVIDMDAGFGDEQLAVPSVDMGEPVAPESIETDAPPIEPVPLSDPSPEELPAPGLPEPPGANDTEIPQIDPGEVLPPPVRGEQEPNRPGKIELPPGVRGDSGIPEKLKIHAGLTSGVQENGDQNQMSVVIHVVDKLGQTVDLESFDIDAELSIVLLDPSRQPAESRIGRWDFPREKIATLIQKHPISAIRVPVEWNGDLPKGKEIVVHARLRAEEDDMRCQRRVAVKKDKVIAEWTPRGNDVRR